MNILMLIQVRDALSALIIGKDRCVADNLYTDLLPDLGFDQGLCANIHRVCATMKRYYSVNGDDTWTYIIGLMHNWPEYCGDLVYPIPGGSAAFISAKREGLLYEGEYGEQRKKLAIFMIQTINNWIDDNVTPSTLIPYMVYRLKRFKRQLNAPYCNAGLCHLLERLCAEAFSDNTIMYESSMRKRIREYTRYNVTKSQRVKGVCKTWYKDLALKLALSWDKFSGSLAYPVPSPSDEHPRFTYQRFLYTPSMFTGLYGNDRIELLNMLIDKLESSVFQRTSISLIDPSHRWIIQTADSSFSYSTRQQARDIIKRVRYNSKPKLVDTKNK